MQIMTQGVMFQKNIQLNLSRVAMTLLFGTLHLKLALQVLCESSGFMGICVVQGHESMGDIPGVGGGDGFQGRTGEGVG